MDLQGFRILARLFQRHQFLCHQFIKLSIKFEQFAGQFFPFVRPHDRQQGLFRFRIGFGQLVELLQMDIAAGQKKTAHLGDLFHRIVGHVRCLVETWHFNILRIEGVIQNPGHFENRKCESDKADQHHHQKVRDHFGRKFHVRIILLFSLLCAHLPAPFQTSC